MSCALSTRSCTEPPPAQRREQARRRVEAGAGCSQASVAVAGASTATPPPSPSTRTALMQLRVLGRLLLHVVDVAVDGHEGGNRRQVLGRTLRGGTAANSESVESNCVADGLTAPEPSGGNNGDTRTLHVPSSSSGSTERGQRGQSSPARNRWKHTQVHTDATRHACHPRDRRAQARCPNSAGASPTVAIPRVTTTAFTAT